jgi:hypothetical protein
VCVQHLVTPILSTPILSASSHTDTPLYLNGPSESFNKLANKFGNARSPPGHSLRSVLTVSLTGKVVGTQLVLLVSLNSARLKKKTFKDNGLEMVARVVSVIDRF